MKLSLLFISIALLMIQERVECQVDCPAALDLVFIVDSSGSVGINSFNEAKTAMKAMVDRFNIGENNALIGLINYSTTVHTLLGFILQQQFWSQDMVKSKIDSMNYLAQTTATGDAIYAARTSIFTTTRGIVPRLAIVFTDGQSNTGRPVATEAQLLKDEGVDIFAVGIGSGINDAELDTIASVPKSTYKLHISGYNALYAAVNNITQIACNTNAFIPLFTIINVDTPLNQQKFYQANLQKYPKGGYAQIKVKHNTGRTNFYYSTTEKNPKTSNPFGRSTTLTNTNEYLVSIPAGTPRLYLTAHGIENLNKADFEVQFFSF